MEFGEDIDILKAKTKKSFSFLIFREFIIKIISFLGQLFIFRLLRPEDFGVFVIISFIVNFVGLFTDIGLNQTLIQKKDKLTKEELSSIFYIVQLLTILLFVIFFIAAPLVTIFYPKFGSEQILMVRVLSVTLLLKPLRTLLTALFERNLKYQIVAKIDILGTIGYQIALVFFALNNFSVWSFIYAVLIKEILELSVAFYYKPWCPLFYFNLNKVRKMLNFGIFIQGYNFMIFIHDAINPLIVGRVLGSYSVGLLDWSLSVSSLARYVTDNYNRVALSAFSRLQEKEKNLLEFIEKSINYLSIFGLYFTVMILSVGQDMVHYLFTDKWLPGLPSLYLFTIFILMNTIVSPLIVSIIALGKSKQLLKLSMATGFMEIGVVYFLIYRVGYLAVPIAGLINMIISSFGFLMILKYEKQFYVFLKAFIQKLLFSLAIIVLINILNALLMNSIITFILKAGIATFLFALFLFIFSRKDFNQLFLLFRGYLKEKI